MHYESRNPDIALEEWASDLKIDNADFEGMIASINSKDCFYIPSLDSHSTHSCFILYLSLPQVTILPWNSIHSLQNPVYWLWRFLWIFPGSICFVSLWFFIFYRERTFGLVSTFLYLSILWTLKINWFLYLFQNTWSYMLD